jgi:hypothetical protein
MNIDFLLYTVISLGITFGAWEIGNRIMVKLEEREYKSGYYELIPPWAVARAYGFLVEGAQLPTRDGRKIGNAHIIYANSDPEGKYQILTDAGNIVHLSGSEVRTLFHSPIYVSDVAEVIHKFYTPKKA